VEKWLRFEHAGKPGFGKLVGGTITVYQGDLFGAPAATAQTLPLASVRLLTPCQPTKMIAIWNNFHALAAKLNLAIPQEPLFFIKTSNCFLAGGETIRYPKSFNGKVVYEGELGVVIGKTARAVQVADAPGHIFGYTCINDVTAADIINRDPAFQQWSRAKSYDTFGVFGPVIATGLDPATLSVKTVLNGQERQNYPVSDMIFAPAQLVSLISQDMTLFPGDVICCGTSVGVGSMKPGSTIEITIEGIGTLANKFE
jgi:2-keto-4-pentenoate hydratase/2-oxohepta-3-ene-1,7-dioic acid hydratase in catechol pathway